MATAAKWETISLKGGAWCWSPAALGSRARGQAYRWLEASPLVDVLGQGDLQT